MTVRRSLRLRWSLVTTLVAVGSLVFVDAVSASNAVAGLQEGGGDVTVPTWLYLLTGGAVIGASGLLSMLVTDRAFIDAVYRWSRGVPLRRSVRRIFAVVVGSVGLVVLTLVIYTGLTGPQFSNANFAVLLTFVGGRAGLTMIAYLLGNPWPAINPWRFIARRLPHGFLPYPTDLGVVPAILGLIALIWIETVVPVAAKPATLAVVVLGYSIYTLTGAVVFSPVSWFRYADPLSVLFRYYGTVAPIQRTADGIALRLPGASLRDGETFRDLSGVAFVVLLVWELTYSGFITTAPGARTIGTVVGRGVPPAVAYLVLLVGGYVFFLSIYWFAARRARRRAETYLSVRYLAFRFAPPLLGIAVGYHLAHYFAFFISLSPSLAGVLLNPFSPPLPPRTLVVPGWFGLLEICFVLLGHLLAIWVAHATSFETFSGRLQAIRSQFPFVLVMVVYTILSLWLLSLPVQSPPFVG